MPVALNQTVETLPVSVSMQFHTNARAMKAADPTLIDLSAGEPDFDTPAPVLAAGLEALTHGETHYATAQGMPELRAAVAQKLAAENGCVYAPEEIILTPGSKFALYLALRTLVSPGERVLYLTPAYVSYAPMIQAAGGVPVAVDLKWADNYRITREALEEKAADGVKALLLNCPNNPTGRVLTREEAEEVHAFLLAHPDCAVISDEIYEKIVYDGHRSVSMASYADIRDRAVTVNGFSKSAAMTGWRAGYLAAPAYIVKAALRLQQHSVISVAPFTQRAAMSALAHPEETERMRLAYANRRRLFTDALNAIPGAVCRAPEGAFYAWVRFEGYALGSGAMSEYLLRNAKVVGVPGEAYGPDEGCVRFCFARKEEELLEAAERIREALGKLGCK